MITKAPFTNEQVENLKSWQRGPVHEFTCTCSSDEPLEVNSDGFFCTACGKTQDWCHDYMADGSALKSMDKFFEKFK